MSDAIDGLQRFKGQRRALRAGLLLGAACVAFAAAPVTVSAAPGAEASPAAGSAAQTSAGETPLLTVAPDNAFACAQTLKDGVLSTHAFINYAYTDSRDAGLAPGKGSASGALSRQRIGQASVCRMWHGPLRAMEISALLQSLAAKHPEQRDIAVLGIAGQD